MAATDLTVGYPVHAVATYRQETNRHGVLLTYWTAACGASDVKAGTYPFGSATHARRAELCKLCWPYGHGTHHPPVRKEE